MDPTRVDALNAARKIVSDCLERSSANAPAGVAPGGFGRFEAKSEPAVERIIVGAPILRGAHPLKAKRPAPRRSWTPDWMTAATLLVLSCSVLVMCFISMH